MILAAPLVDKPFEGTRQFLNHVNFVPAELRMDGTLEKLEIKYLGRKPNASKRL